MYFSIAHFSEEKNTEKTGALTLGVFTSIDSGINFLSLMVTLAPS